MKVLEIQNPPSVEALVECFGRQPLSFVLDSAQSNDGLGAWSFFGSDPFQTVTGDLEDLRQAMQAYPLESHPEIPFTGGAVGYLSYDYGRRLERVPCLAQDDRSIPDMSFALYDGVAALNHQSGMLYLIGHDVHMAADAVIERLRSIVGARLVTPASESARVSSESLPFCQTAAGVTSEAPTTGASAAMPARRGAWQWNFSKADFCTAVQRVRDYIASGDVYQVNLSQRARCTFEGDSIALYQALRRGNPAPYGAYLDLGDWQLISTSPEQFLQKRGRALETRPIKGTRPRGASAEEDLQQAAALRASEKDRAELLMIVDLERNDLGRIAEFGSVQVEGLYQLEHYARVIHQTARVKARLREGKDVYDALAALFPGGSITGAPKVRAMEIIEALEPTRRGAYCGSIGYIGFDGDAEFNIAIRSLHLKAGQLDYQVGGGIVWDSQPEAEYQETLDKARAIREAIDQLCQTSS
ncbi:aminodeoxychorismate synthase component I [Coraliomargarita sp. SDUM461003]|uniref:aminodeoxychorismate synthase n=1 Tax=Thalassobacterium maritimum TaxID=3041265 RepID=A0ABU1ASM7_9BACT|nr:aminodeoxychorismate synthase component I [Coraliomargarita sp. SDUM461003]MDQ8207164.1 aminodeoxychorismate synthase component I [Coraliomargarita sp. SDUM461003]